MPTTRISMRHIKEVLRLKFAARLSHRQIARSLGLSVGVVAKYLTAASNAGLTFPLPAEMDDAQLLRALRAATSSPPAGGVVSSIVSPPRLREPDWATIHTEPEAQRSHAPLAVGGICCRRHTRLIQLSAVLRPLP